MKNAVRLVASAALFAFPTLAQAAECPAQCPEGWKDLGGACEKPKPYGRGSGYPWKYGDGLNNKAQFSRCEAGSKGKCEQEGTVVYPKCKEGFHKVGCCICAPTCPAGFTDGDKSCTKPACEKQ